MKTNYYYKTIDTMDDDCYYVKSDKKIEVNDYMILLDYDNEPFIVKVSKTIDELSALTDDNNYVECISTLDIKPFLEKRKMLVQKAKLIDQMKKEIELQKMEDMLKKNSTANDKLSELYKQYVGLNEDKTHNNDIANE